MGNLGHYQTITTMAKQVGGPVNLAILFAGTAATVTAAPTIAMWEGGKCLYRKIKQKHQRTQVYYCQLSSATYTFSKNVDDKSGISFHAGDKFSVLESDGDAVLIERKNDENSPYFVSAEMLHQNSDY